ncbi:SOUL heme-binding family protein [Actinidia rufa]|uniref:SOUL heme-binding family protein n=1 Tax=Actinidia rufa TaxID=165716 RepID=A0A7J0E716_9ERIC|nr:SOUL heme-binding family protein [Actinidia rufa]
MGMVFRKNLRRNPKIRTNSIHRRLRDPQILAVRNRRDHVRSGPIQRRQGRRLQDPRQLHRRPGESPKHHAGEDRDDGTSDHPLGAGEDSDDGAGGDEGREGNKAVTMQFTLPAKYQVASEAPQPVDERVILREEGERTYGVFRFGGGASADVVAGKVAALRRSLERDGYKVVGEFLLGRYNPPWSLPAFRTNEVLLPIE